MTLMRVFLSGLVLAGLVVAAWVFLDAGSAPVLESEDEETVSSEGGGAPGGGDRSLDEGGRSGSQRGAEDAINVARDAEDSVAPADLDAAGRVRAAAQAGLSVVGRVVDEAGRPLPEVRVVAIESRWSRIADDERPHALTDGEGRFRIEEARRGSDAWVRAQPDELVWAEVPMAAPKDGVVNVGELVAVEGGAISGTVVDERGLPVPGADVSVRSSPNKEGTMGLFLFGTGGAERRVETDESGRFHLTGVAVGSATLVASTRGYMRTRSAAMAVARGKTTEGVELRLKPGWSIAGVVVDGSGAPLEGATVSVNPDAFEIGEAVGLGESEPLKTDALGYFEAVGLREAVHNVFVTMDRHLPVRRRGISAGTQDLRIELQTSAVIVGRVFGPGKEPIEEFELSVQGEAWGGRGQDGVTVLRNEELASMLEDSDLRGRFAIEGTSSERVFLSVTAEGYSKAFVGPVSAKTEDTRPVEVELSPGLKLHGVVLGPDDRPVEGASVVLSKRGQEERQLLFEGGMAMELSDLGDFAGREAETKTRYQAAKGSDETDEEGRFHLSGIAAGEYRLGARHERYVAADDEQVELAIGEPVAEYRLRLKAGGSLVGRTFDATGSLLPNARVKIARSEPSGDASGISRAFAMISGEVGGHRRLGGESSGGTSDGDARYEVHGIPPGDYLARVEKVERRSGAHMIFGGDADERSGVPVKIEAGEVVELDLSLEAKGRLVVHVSDAGRAVSGVRVAVNQQGGSSLFGFGRQTPLTDSDGDCAFEDLAVGDYSVKVTPPGGAPALTNDSAVVAGGDHRLDIELPTGRVEGQVVDADGAGVAGVVVRLTRVNNDDSSNFPAEARLGVSMVMSIDGGGLGLQGANDVAQAFTFSGSPSAPAAVRTGSDGGFVVPYVGEGDYSLRCSGSTIVRPAPTPVSVDADQASEPLRITVEPGGTLVVTVRNSGRGRVRGELVSQEDPTAKRRQNSFGDSALRFEGLRPGLYDLEVSSGERHHRATVEVVVGERQVDAELR